jgi:23S rRNA pseudouridine1911/1915/1917 synthase
MPQPPFQNYHVGPEHAGLALVAAMRKFLPGQSWSEVRRLITKRYVQINGNLCIDEGRKLAATDVVKIWREPRDRIPEPDDVKIVYSDSHLVVVEKPAGVTTQRHSEESHWPDRRKQNQPTIDEIVARLLARKFKNKSPNRGAAGRSPRPTHVRLVHRLDRETSGVMVLALSADAEKGLVGMFRKHDMHRVYHAIVVGRVEAQTFESSLVRDRGDRRRGSTNLPNIGKRATTHVSPLEFFDGYTLVECRLETGRTHQIRIHLAESGHPVCGDKTYNRPLFGKPIIDNSGAQRQALHAIELGFKHPITGQPLEFKMALPVDMQKLLRKLRGG